jgi:hypothetical protein
MSVLVVTGDVGGTRAIIPVLDYLSERNEPFTVVEHGFLKNEAVKKWKTISASLHGNNSLESLFGNSCFKALIFTTSVKDIFPLKVARLARDFGVYVICLLDNWMNYRYRLEIDGQQVFLPNLYLVMDDLAFEEARKEGLPEHILKVVGQPALASLGEEYHQWSIEDKRREFEILGLRKNRKLIIFISEPVESDQGASPESPQYRGYTEKIVLVELCKRLQPFADKYQLGIIPHPREDTGELDKLWQQHRGVLQGGLIKTNNGRQAVFLADGVAGMVSILLYEAWLINKPVISLQPGLCRPQLDFMRKREGVFCVTVFSEWPAAMKAWMREIDKTNEPVGIKKELELHMRAPGNIGEIIISCASNKGSKVWL